MLVSKRLFTIALFCWLTITTFANDITGMISGKVLSTNGNPIDFATVVLKGTSHSASANEKGIYHITAPAGKYTLVFSCVGFEKKEMPVEIKASQRIKVSVKLKPATELAEVIVVGNQLSKLKNSAFNATAKHSRTGQYHENLERCTV